MNCRPCGFVGPALLSTLRQTNFPPEVCAREFSKRNSSDTVMSADEGLKSQAFSRRSLLSRSLTVATAAIVVDNLPLCFLGHNDSALASDQLGTEGELVETPNYVFRVPPGFSKNVASLSSGRVAKIFVAEDDNDSYVTMVETPVQSDFQQLTSFGPIANVISTIIPPSVEGNKLISVDTDSRKNAYIFEYLMKPSAAGPLRHLITVFSLMPGQYLYTLTCQAKEENWEAKKTSFRSAADSYSIKF